MGTHIQLYNRQLLPLFQGQEIPQPTLLFLDPAAPKELRDRHPGGMSPGGTSNFILMAAAGWLLWAVRFGKPADQADAALRFRDLAARQRQQGMWLLEQSACDPHAQFHLSAMVANRMAAREGHLNDVLAESDQQFRWLMGLYSAGATPDGEIILPCTRAGTDRDGQRTFSEPRTQVGSAIFRLLRGLPQVGAAKKPEFWTDPVWGGGAPAAVKKLLEAGDKFGLPGRPAEMPHLRLPMTSHREPGGHWAKLDGQREGQPIVSSVRVVYRTNGPHEVTDVKDWSEPPVDHL